MDNNDKIMKAGGNESPERTAKPVKRSIRFFLEQLATALDVNLSPQRMLIYVAELSDLSENALDFAFKQALRYFKPEFGVMFPVPAELRQWAAQYNPEQERIVRDTRESSDKPEGWTPVDPAEVREWMYRALSKLDGVTAMDAPPKPRGEPERNERAGAMALERLGGSSKPADPWGSNWHETMARRNGWKS